MRADVAIAGDLKAVLQDWLPLVKAAQHDAWITRISDLAGGPTVRDIEELPDDGRLLRGARHPRHLEGDRRQAPSSSPTSASTRCGRRSTTRSHEPGTFITSGGLGTMGFGLPAAIGAKMARPDAKSGPSSATAASR